MNGVRELQSVTEGDKSTIIIIIIIIIIRYQQKRNRNTRELFCTEHDQRFSSTRKGRKLQMGPSRHFCPIKLPSAGNLKYPLNFSVTFKEKIPNFPSFNILLYRNYFMFP